MQKQVSKNTYARCSKKHGLNNFQKENAKKSSVNLRLKKYIEMFEKCVKVCRKSIKNVLKSLCFCSVFFLLFFFPSLTFSVGQVEVEVNNVGAILVTTWGAKLGGGLWLKQGIR